MRQNKNTKPILVVGGTGKTGKRVAQKLHNLGKEVRVASRGSILPFDWNYEPNWKVVLAGTSSVYLTFYPDLAIPGASEKIAKFCEYAKLYGVEKVTLLSGRGEREAQICEKIVINSGLKWSILRCSWFSQNFSEAFLRDLILSGKVELPVSKVREPFIDADDIADLAVETLISDKHTNQLYEITGPELLTFKEVIGRISSSLNRKIEFKSIPHDQFMQGLKNQGVPNNMSDLISYLFTEVLDGRNEQITDDFEKATGRMPKSFNVYLGEAIKANSWGDLVIV